MLPATRARLTHRYPIAVVIGIVVGVLHRAAGPTDYGSFVAAGRDIWSGHWGHVFADPLIQAGPLQLLGVSAFSPLRTIHRGLDLAAINIVFATGMTTGLVWLCDYLRRSAMRAARPAAALALCVVAAACGVIADPSAVGHPAEVVVPALWLIAAHELRHERAFRAGLCLAVATGLETWALLGIALVVLATTRPAAARFTASFAVGSAVLWVPFIASGNFNMFKMVWFVAPHTLAGHMTSGATFTAPMRAGQLVAAVGIAAIVGWATKTTPLSPWLVLVTAVTVRLLLDPLQSSYYWLPLIVMSLSCLVIALDLSSDIKVLTLALAYCQVIGFEDAAKTGMLSLSLLLVGAISLRTRQLESPRGAPRMILVRDHSCGAVVAWRPGGSGPKSSGSGCC